MRATGAGAKPYLDPAGGYHVLRLCEDLAVRRSDLAQATKRSSQALRPQCPSHDFGTPRRHRRGSVYNHFRLFTFYHQALNILFP